MAELAKKRYKGIEFSESFNMKEEDFNNRFEGCHIFKKMTDVVRTAELKVAYLIASKKKSEGDGPKIKQPEVVKS